MKLETKVRTLGPVSHAPLKDVVASLPPEAWIEDPMRQNAFYVHAQTQSIVLLFCEGWPQIKLTKKKGWSEYSRYASPLMKEIVQSHYPIKGTVIRAMLAKLVAGGVIEEHMDDHPSFAVAHRIHVPLLTNDDVDFVIGGETFHLQEGVAYEVSNLDYHSVVNRSAQDRVHFIFDYVLDARAS